MVWANLQKDSQEAAMAFLESLENQAERSDKVPAHLPLEHQHSFAVHGHPSTRI
ncbi:unnamed protein product [Effrenium voratum]|nr:unnamed protein product [Effrenium voratum]